MSSATTGGGGKTCPVRGQPFRFSYSEGGLRYVRIYGYRHDHRGRVYLHAMDGIDPSERYPHSGYGGGR